MVSASSGRRVALIAFIFSLCLLGTTPALQSPGKPDGTRLRGLNGSLLRLVSQLRQSAPENAGALREQIRALSRQRREVLEALIQERAAEAAELLLARLGIPAAQADRLQTIPAEQIVAALSGRSDISLRYVPVVDGKTLPALDPRVSPGPIAAAKLRCYLDSPWAGRDLQTRVRVITGIESELARVNDRQGLERLRDELRAYVGSDPGRERQRSLARDLRRFRAVPSGWLEGISAQKAAARPSLRDSVAAA